MNQKILPDIPLNSKIPSSLCLERITIYVYLLSNNHIIVNHQNVLVELYNASKFISFGNKEFSRTIFINDNISNFFSFPIF